MKKLYEKNELVFAILWIVAYCVGAGTVRGNFGDDSYLMTAALAVFAIGIFVFVKVNKLEEKYGLCKWKGKAGDYWFFIPLFILMTGNLWCGFGMAYDGINQVYAVVSMLLIGFIEEMIFRGFLFRVLLKKDPAPVAIIISAVTFGIGHIINLFTGQATIDTAVQIVYAIAVGFIFTIVFYKSGNLVICIIVHSLIDAFSKFRASEYSNTVSYVYFGLTFVIALAYGLYLSKKPAALSKEQFPIDN